jgi:ribosomal protein S18 acetylase RimI-like enzyme
MQTATEPVRLQPHDLKRAERVLARAFHDDPGIVWMLPDERQRRRFLGWSHGALLRNAMRKGLIFTTPGEVAGAALWLPPQRPMMSLLDAIRVGMLAAPFLLTPGQLRRMVLAIVMFEDLHRKDPPKRHWYLNVLGVEPDRQGKGIGGNLITPILEHADRRQLACYLETGKEINVTFYQKHGFEVVREGSLPMGGPRWWTMLREPIG